MKRTILATSALAAVLVIGMILGLSNYQTSLANDGTDPDTPPIPREVDDELSEITGSLQVEQLPERIENAPPSQTVNSGGMSNSDTFVQNGGRAAIIVKTETPISEGSRGSVVVVPVTLSYKSGSNPIESVTIKGGSVQNGFIPASIADRTTSEERAQELQSTGKISGALDLRSTISFEPKEIVLHPGESQKASVIITIPKDWPEEAVGSDIGYGFTFVPAESYDSKELMIKQDSLVLHLVK